MNPKRAYTMTARAEATEATGRRILRAAFDLHTERVSTDIGLEDVAARAGVSVQTVLRKFGSRAALVEASFEFAREEVAEERKTPVGDIAAAVRTIVDHYERRGDTALVLLAQEDTEKLFRRTTDEGKRMHRSWVREVFAPYLDARPAASREELTDLLVVATDVYAWKLLRRDRRLSRAVTERRINRLVMAVLGAKRENAEKET
jgi:AcrR family transcriptional regulator